MKKIKFILLNFIIITFAAASLTFAADVKKTAANPSPVPPVAAATVTKAPVQNQVKPAAVKTPVPNPVPAAAATNAPVQNPKPLPSTGTKAPVQIPTQLAPLAANVTAANATAPGQSQPAVTISSGEIYNYNPLGKPDPFRPFIAVETVEKKKVEKKEPLSIFPLQRADTENYKVVGIAGDEENRVAIAEDAAKKFYPLVKGTRIGLRNGKVVEIMSDRVIVEEYDKKKAKRVILKLRKN